MSSDKFLSNPGSLEAYSASLTTALSTIVKLSQKLPPAADLPFHRSIASDEFVQQLDGLAGDLSSITRKLCSLSSGTPTTTAPEDEDVEDQWERVADVVDTLLERTDICFDKIQGRAHAGEDNAAVTTSTPIITEARQGFRVIHASNIIRPQTRFPDTIDNSPAPFYRKLRTKPNALVPLSYHTPSAENSGDEDWDSHHRSLGITDTLVSMPHPYAYEIAHLKTPASILSPHDPIPFLPFDTTSAQWIDTPEALENLAEKLDKVDLIAVDLEAHQIRSFQGFTCLMQISTRTEDFIIDTLAVRGFMHILNQPFTSPKILKIFHGATSDIGWLQRDFGLYIVGLFDTYHASKVLSFPQFSLAYLLKKYADVDADKKYQLADWRIRPIPEEMLSYARADTHYLLYIFDRLRNELLGASSHDGNLLHEVLRRSNETSLIKYEKEMYDARGGEGPGGWRNLLHKWNRPLNTAQFSALKAIHAWRDQVAREEDESVRYVLPNHQLFILAERMPTESAAVIGSCSPTPTLVRIYASDLALLIQQAKLDAEEELRVKQAAGVATTSSVNEAMRGSHKRFGDEEGAGMTSTTRAKRFLPSPLSEAQVAEASVQEVARATTKVSRFFGTALTTPQTTAPAKEKKEGAKRVKYVVEGMAEGPGLQTLPEGAQVTEAWTTAGGE